MSGCGIVGELFTILAPGIAKNQSLNKLNLSDQKIGAQGYDEVRVTAWDVVFAASVDAPSLGWWTDSASQLANALGENATLCSLGLSNTAADSVSFTAFLKRVDEGNVSLKEVDASGNKGLASVKDWQQMLAKIHFQLSY